MKLLYIFLLSLLCSTSLYPQLCKFCDNDPEYSKLMAQADSCVMNLQDNCISLYKSMLEKGRNENVKFIDFLYFKYVQSFMYYDKFDSIIYYGHMALDEPTEYEVDIFNMIGNSYMMLGKVDSSVHYMIRVANILEEKKDSVHLAYVYTNLGIIIGEMANDSLAVDYHKKSYYMQRKLKLSKYLSTVASNIALGYYHIGNHDSTYVWAKKSIEIADTTNDIVGKIHGYYSLALIDNDPNERLRYAKKSMDLAKSINQKNIYADVLYLYAFTLNLLGRNDEAMEYADESYKINLEVNKTSGIMKSASIAADIYYDNQQFKKAADYYRIYVSYKDSLLTEENRLLVNELTKKYETEKKEKQLLENELLISKKNTQIRFGIITGSVLILSLLTVIFQYKRNQKNKIEKLEKEKELTVLRAWMNGEERERNRISRDLHDGVASMISAAKLNLQTIPYLSKEKADIQVEKVSGILELTHIDVRRIAHNLLPVVLEKEGFIAAVEQFISHINETGLLQINMTQSGSSFPDLYRPTALMLYRIVQELINNIIKHAQASHASIHVDYSNHGELIIEVRDNGIGFQPGNENQGLFSIKERLSALGGSFDIDKASAKGTIVCLKVKINAAENN